MRNEHGDFIWYELLTTDANAAAAFYKSVIGWNAVNANQPGMDYNLFYAGDPSDTMNGVGGFMTITPEMEAGGSRPAWIGYIAVEDVDKAVTDIIAAGGTSFMTMDVENVGRMAMVADPQGALFYVMRGASSEPSHSFAAIEPKVGHCAWNELSTTDPEAAKTFYSKLFGWAKDGDLDMGTMGKYEFLRVAGGRFLLGAVMPKMPQMPVSAWTYYFRVPDIDAAVDALKAAGGTLHMEPMEIPGGDYSLSASDPQGAAFGLVGPRL